MSYQNAPLRFARTASLEIAYEEHGRHDGIAAILLHGFPYDPRAYDQVAPLLANAGLRVIVPYLRGYGPTRFLSPDTLRSGQQAALAQDLIDLMDTLKIERAALAGYDWGGRAACIAAALWPERVHCLVTGNGYNLQNIPGSVVPQSPEAEHRYWYQYYFHTPRGAAGLAADRRGFCRLLWKLWSPTWQFDDACFEASAASFDNPDFVDVVIHSYRHRYGYVTGDPALESIEAALTKLPPITVPTISICGADDGVAPPTLVDRDAQRFAGGYQRIILPGVGHNMGQEAPAATAEALLKLLAR
jgi:pimeloyl-ACP methyl ester carboxylesterase